MLSSELKKANRIGRNKMPRPAPRSEYTKGQCPGGARALAVLTEQMKPFVDKFVEELNYIDHQNGRAIGGRETLGQITSRLLDHDSAINVIRRIYDITNSVTRTVPLTLADALLIAGGTTLNESGLHVIATSPRGAEEMVDGWEFAKGVRIPRPERDELKAELLEIARAMTHTMSRRVVGSPLALELMGGTSECLLECTCQTPDGSRLPTFPADDHQPHRKSGIGTRSSSPGTKTRRRSRRSAGERGSIRTFSSSTAAGANSPTGATATL